eukprot:1055487-Pleurochrysis_carterae.AAC.2
MRLRSLRTLPQTPLKTADAVAVPAPVGAAELDGGRADGVAGGQWQRGDEYAVVPLTSKRGMASPGAMAPA